MFSKIIPNYTNIYWFNINNKSLTPIKDTFASLILLNLRAIILFSNIIPLIFKLFRLYLNLNWYFLIFQMLSLIFAYLFLQIIQFNTNQKIDWKKKLNNFDLLFNLFRFKFKNRIILTKYSIQNLIVKMCAYVIN